MLEDIISKSESILSNLHTVEAIYIYISLFIIALLENIIPPIPGDVPIAFAGSLIAPLVLSAPMCIIFASLGSTLGFMIMYILGLKTSDVISGRADPDTTFGHWMVKFFSKENLISASSNFRKYGYGLVLLNRFLPGTRSIISIAAGMSRLNFIIIHISAAISATAWNILLIYGGMTLGAAWETITVDLSWYGLILTIILVGIFTTAYIIYKYKKRQKK